MCIRDSLKSAPEVQQHLLPQLPEYRPYNLVFSGYDQQDQLGISSWSDPQSLERVMSRIHKGFVKCLGERGKQCLSYLKMVATPASVVRGRLLKGCNNNEDGVNFCLSLGVEQLCEV